MKPLWDSYAADERRCARQPPINMGAPAPKIWDIPRKIVIPDDVGDEIHVHTCANLAGRDFPSMEALDFPAISKDEWVLASARRRNGTRRSLSRHCSAGHAEGCRRTSPFPVPRETRPAPVPAPHAFEKLC